MLQYIGLLDPLKLHDSDKVKTHLVKHQDFLSLSEFLSDFSASSDAVMYRLYNSFLMKGIINLDVNLISSIILRIIWI